MSEAIDISGLDKHELIAALHNYTRPLGLGFLHDVGDIIVEQVRTEIPTPDYIDYYHGRPLKVRLTDDSFDPRLYDRDAGSGAAAHVVATLRARAAAE